MASRTFYVTFIGNKDEVPVDLKKEVIGLLSLPVEVVVYIALLLMTRDKVNLLYVSHRLKTIMESPLMWHAFVWPQYREKEELGCVKNLLKWCGVYVKQLSFPDNVPQPPQLWRMLHCCSNVVELNLTTTKRHQVHLSVAIAHLTKLKKLSVQWNGDFLSLFAVKNSLKELTVRTQYSLHEPSLYRWIIDGLNEGFKVHVLNIVYSNVQFYVKDLLGKWTLYNSYIPDGHTGHLRLYSSLEDLLHSLPTFQLQFGKAATLPFLNANKCDQELVDEEDLILLTIFTHTNTKGVIQEHNAIQTIDLNLMTNFQISTDLLNSKHLESLAALCPNLQMLNLQNCTNCLGSLEGLHSVATCCCQLVRLNLLRISAAEVDHVELWKVLSNMSLTHLALDLCNTAVLPNYAQVLAGLYNKCSSLEALHLDRYVCKDTIEMEKKGCPLCKCYVDDHLLLLSNFPSLNFCLLENMPCHCVKAIENILTNCSHLKYFKYSLDPREAINYHPFHSLQPYLSFPFTCNLQQLFMALPVDIPDHFLNTVSAHGGLVHVIFEVFSISNEGIVTLIESSPNLLTIHVYGTVWVNDQSFTPDSVDDFKETMQMRFPSRVLFTAAGSIEMSRTSCTRDYTIHDFLHKRIDVKPLWLQR